MLGRGLASLIPKRNIDAKKLEEIDNLDIVPEEQQNKSYIYADMDRYTEEKPVPMQTPEPSKKISVMDEDDAQEEDVQPEEKTPEPPSVPQEPQEPETPVAQEEKPEEAPAIMAEEDVLSITPEPAPVTTMYESGDRAVWDKHEEVVQHINVSDITINPLQPRREFDPMHLEELKQSIQVHGILQPLVVRRLEHGYELIAGERRLRAVKTLNWEKVPCVVRSDVQADRTRLELALIENVQRNDLNPVEEALAYKQLVDDYGMSHEDIAERIGISRVAVTNTLRLLQLPNEIQQGLAEGKITTGHARAILMIPDPEKQIRFYHHLVQEGLTVRKAEIRARKVQRAMKVTDPARRKMRGRSYQAMRLSGFLEDAYNQGVSIKFLEARNRFEVTFVAHNEGELKTLVRQLLKNKKKDTDLDFLEEEEE